MSSCAKCERLRVTLDDSSLRGLLRSISLWAEPHKRNSAGSLQAEDIVLASLRCQAAQPDGV